MKITERVKTIAQETFNKVAYYFFENPMVFNIGVILIWFLFIRGIIVALSDKNHPYLFVYLLGAVLVVALNVTKIFLFLFVNWLFKINIALKNMRKILPPDDLTFWNKTYLTIIIITYESLFSWINVLWLSWKILAVLLNVVRDELQPAPEVIKAIRFSLRNNPDMPRESVWAYMQAANVLVGEKLPNVDDIVSSLNDVRGMYPSFNHIQALRQLISLEVVNPGITSAALVNLEQQHR